MTGFVHSRETFGTVDGPGVRYVLFLSGCPLRCRYCHNPDTWATPAAEELTPEEVLAEYRKNRAIYENGGITVTGGEPLVQTGFVTELFEKAHAEGIHTALDTSGITFDPENTEEIDRLLDACDLVLLDLKHMDSAHHRALTGRGNENVLAFARHLSRRGIKTHVRHVLVPTLTDSEEHLKRLAAFIATLKNVEKIDLLPYHTMGKAKYASLGIPDPLPDVAAATEKDVARARGILTNALANCRRA